MNEGGREQDEQRPEADAYDEAVGLGDAEPFDDDDADARDDAGYDADPDEVTDPDGYLDEDDAEGLADDEADEDFADRFGSGIEDRADEPGTSRRTLGLAVVGLGIGVAAVIGLLAVLLPEPSTAPDIRPDLRSRAESARSDLVDVHKQQLGDLLAEAPGAGARPDVTVVCDIVPAESEQRQQRCELRATSLVAPAAVTNPADVPTAACEMRELTMNYFPPLLARAPKDGCGGPAPFLWYTRAGGTTSDTYAGWTLEAGAGQKTDGEAVAVITRHDLGAFDIGACPESGCGWEHVQLPNVDFHTGDEKR